MRRLPAGQGSEQANHRNKRGASFLKTPAPRQPLVRGAGRLVIDILDACLRELFAERLRSRPFRRPYAEEEDLDLLVEGGCIGEHAVARGLRVESAAAATTPAEAADVGEFVEIRQRRAERLRATHQGSNFFVLGQLACHEK